jgi:quinol-cytochrome oxidoreductase complex cytochrome b subunit
VSTTPAPFPEQAGLSPSPEAGAPPNPDEDARFSFRRPSPWIRGATRRNFPLRKLLPDREPSYVSSSLYTMGVLTLAALIVAILSGAIIALGGVSWWHTNRFGAFMNSIHFWSVQAMFLFMAVHFIFNFFIQAWRGGRAWTWITGVLAFILTILTSFTGFLMMTNWDSQWIGQQAKDAFNALGIGSIWNVMDAGQQFTMHVVVTVGLLLIIVTLHLGLVRRRGVVPPPGAENLEVAENQPYMGEG